MSQLSPGDYAGTKGLCLSGLFLAAFLAACGGGQLEYRDLHSCAAYKGLPYGPDAPPPGAMRFTDEMTPPKLLSSPDPAYTPEAYDAKVQGKVRARCVITELGSIGECNDLDAPTGAESIAEGALSRLRYSPATLGGEPIAVEYPVEFDLKLPSSRPPDEPPRPNPTVMPFKGKDSAEGGEGMERPMLISGGAPTFSRRALDYCVEGLMSVRCTIELDGSITDCRVERALPYMEQEVVRSLMTRKYTPVRYKGEPVRVDYVFNVKLAIPSREAQPRSMLPR